MKSPADDLADFLESRGHGTRRASTGWNISVANEPTDPATVITLYDTGGPGPDTDQMDVYVGTVQVRVRANSYPDGWAKQYAIMQSLVTAPAMTLNGSRYAFIAAETGILAIGKDDHDKEIFTANYRAMRQ